ncbi:hypothetical protein [Ornithinibacillus scapharcae]|uniref:hypothetical protein n=1 Tax=Ornithinibacillus scapharcae TaxID=1147159 RepID=UPI000225AE06|nr:hypothetical protein [Ornithinibacillus scapharcae]
MFKLEFPAKDGQVNMWLDYFHEQSIPVFFTNEVLYRKDRKTMEDEDRIKALDADNLLLSVPSGVEWKQLRKELQKEWNDRFPRLNGFGSKSTSVPKDYHRSRLSFGFNTVIVFGSLFLITYLVIKLVENEVISNVHFIPIVIMLLLGGLLYFYLIRDRLRWFHLLFYIGKVFLFSFAWLISIEETEKVTYQFVEDIIVISVFFPLVAWIPYLILKRIGNNKTK